MSDDPLDPDELASAFIDHELSDAERARVEVDTEIVARATEFERLSSMIAADQPPRDGAVDDAIAAAMSAFDETINPTETNDVIAIDRRRRPYGVLAGIGAAAAAVVGLVVVSSSFGDDHQDTAGVVSSDEPSETTAMDEAFAAEEDMAEAEAVPPAGAPTTAASRAIGDAANMATESATSPLDELDPATLLIETDRLERRLALVDEGGLDSFDMEPDLADRLEACGEIGSVVMVDTLDQIEVVIVVDDLGDNLVVHPDTCQVLLDLVVE